MKLRPSLSLSRYRLDAETLAPIGAAKPVSRAARRARSASA